MADVELTLEGAGQITNGTVSPTAGAAIEVSFDDVTKGSFSVDYTEENAVEVTLGGEFSILKSGQLTLSPGLSANLFTGDLKLSGEATWRFDKATAVTIDSEFSKDGVTVGAKLTFNF